MRTTLSVKCTRPFTCVRPGRAPVQGLNVCLAADKSPEQQANQATETGEEVPIWVRREREQELRKSEGGKDLPFGLYLLFSSFTAIAAVGSIFEFANKNPIFGVVTPDSPIYAPILGFFAVTGLPTAGWLFFKSISAANAEADRMDKVDGM